MSAAAPRSETAPAAATSASLPVWPLGEPGGDREVPPGEGVRLLDDDVAVHAEPEVGRQVADDHVLTGIEGASEDARLAGSKGTSGVDHSFDRRRLFVELAVSCAAATASRQRY